MTRLLGTIMAEGGVARLVHDANSGELMAILAGGRREPASAANGLHHSAIAHHAAPPSFDNPMSDQATNAIAAVVVLLGLLLVLRVVYVRVRYLWRFGQQPRVILRGDAGERHGR